MRSKNLSLSQIIAIREILTCKNLTLAAQKCHATQPGMSILLKKLRNIFDDELIFQTGNTMSLTSKGARLLSKFDALLELILDLEKSDAQTPIADWTDKHYTIATASFLEGIVAEFFLSLRESTHKEITFNIIPYVYTPSLNDFERKHIDLFFGYINQPSNQKNFFTKNKGLIVNELLKDQVCFCLKKKQNAISEPNLSFDEYLALPHIAYAESANPHSINTYLDLDLHKAGLKRNLIGKMTNIDALFQTQQYSGDDIVITLCKLPFDYYQTIYPIDVFPLPIEPVYQSLVLTHKETDKATPALAIFLEAFKNYISNRKWFS